MTEQLLTNHGWTLDDIRRFIRPNFFIFTALQPLLGVAAVITNPRPDVLLSVVGVAIAFHVFAYVENDVFDLPVDKTQPLRSKDPLVTGLITPGAAVAIVLLQIPIAMLVTWWAGHGLMAYVTLLVGFSFMTAYNLFGKRCPVPMITDAVQGIAWGTLAIYGSLVSVGHVTALSFVAASFGFGFIFLINGVHGGLRDLCNDLAAGCNTTAIYFGAHPDGDDVVSTGHIRVFAFVALAIYVGPATAALFMGDFGYESPLLVNVAVAWLIVNVVSVQVLYLITERSIENRNQIIRFHGIPLLLSPIIVFLPRMSSLLSVTVLLCYCLPILILDRPKMDGVRWFLSRK